jgi:hypothetical protein
VTTHKMRLGGILYLIETLPTDRTHTYVRCDDLRLVAAEVNRLQDTIQSLQDKIRVLSEGKQ